MTTARAVSEAPQKANPGLAIVRVRRVARLSADRVKFQGHDRALDEALLGGVSSLQLLCMTTTTSRNHFTLLKSPSPRRRTFSLALLQRSPRENFVFPLRFQ